tara:strand:- start:18426 stop:18566 length:141 start_codon:yes stop_codon:yes gene_type:complete
MVPLGHLTSDCRFVLVSVRTSDTEGLFVAQPDTDTNNKKNVNVFIN